TRRTIGPPPARRNLPSYLLHLLHDVARAAAAPVHEFVRLAAARDLGDRHFVYLYAFASHGGQYRIPEPTVRVVVFDGDQRIIRGARAGQQGGLIDRRHTVEVHHSDRDLLLREFIMGLQGLV